MFKFTCCDGHVLIGYDEARHGHCPLCIALGQIKRLMNIVNESAARQSSDTTGLQTGGSDG